MVPSGRNLFKLLNIIKEFGNLIITFGRNIYFWLLLILLLFDCTLVILLLLTWNFFWMLTIYYILEVKTLLLIFWRYFFFTIFSFLETGNWLLCMNRAYELYLEQIEVHETSYPSSLAVDVLQAYHPDLFCTICYPIAILYCHFWRFWETYQDNYFTITYS